MIKAKFTMGDGRIGVLIGLSRQNVEQLQAGHPIFFDPAQLALDHEAHVGGIAVFYGETEDTMLRDLRGLIGPHSEIFSMPNGDGNVR